MRVNPIFSFLILSATSRKQWTQMRAYLGLARNLRLAFRAERRSLPHVVQSLDDLSFHSCTPPPRMAPGSPCNQDQFKYVSWPPRGGFNPGYRWTLVQQSKMSVVCCRPWFVGQAPPRNSLLAMNREEEFLLFIHILFTVRFANVERVKAFGGGVCFAVGRKSNRRACND